MVGTTGRAGRGRDGTALSIGNFDGVHLGHQHILHRLHDVAADLGVPAVAVTFEPHPLELLSPGTAPARLTPEPIKAWLLRRCPIDDVVVLPIDREFLSITAEAFFQQVVVERFGATALVEGEDFRFGHGRRGDVAMLRRLGSQRGIVVEAVPHVAAGSHVVSSSAIRELLTRGRVGEAAELLGRAHRLVGTVVRGDGRGRALGFPTANLDSVAGMCPADGVYAGRAWVDDANWPAAVSIGGKPTFGDARVGVEAYLIGYEGELYGQRLCLELLDYLRGIETFGTGTELVHQMRHDVTRVRRIVPDPTPDAHACPLAMTRPNKGDP